MGFVDYFLFMGGVKMTTLTNEQIIKGRQWKRGLPKGKFTPQMLIDYEAYPTVMGWVHRKRTEQEKREYQLRYNNKETNSIQEPK